MRILEKIKTVLVSPKNFFQEMKREKGLKKAFLFSVLLSPISILVGMLLNIPDSYGVAVANALAFLPYHFAASIAFLSGWLLTVLLPFVIATIYHIFALALKGKGKYEASYKAAVYSNTPSYLLGWLWFPFSLIVTLWSFALSVLGLKAPHALKLHKAFLVAVSPYAILFLLTLATILVAGSV